VLTRVSDDVEKRSHASGKLAGSIEETALRETA
jgi:hypothetical protein